MNELLCMKDTVGAIRTRYMSPTQKERRANLSSTVYLSDHECLIMGEP